MKEPEIKMKCDEYYDALRNNKQKYKEMLDAGINAHSLSQKFTEKCSDCGKVHAVYTQRDQYPEYYTNINIICECKEVVPFMLPVN